MNHSSLSLERVNQEAFDKAFRWRNSPAIFKWCRQYEPISSGHHARYWASVEKDDSTRMYSVINHDDGADVCVGICGLTSIDWINRRAEFSLYIGPEYQGAGFGEQALRLLCKHGFQALNLNSIWGEVFDHNPAMAMFRRVGFTECGRRRQFYFRDGKYIDAILIDVMRNEWK